MSTDPNTPTHCQLVFVSTHEVLESSLKRLNACLMRDNEAGVKCVIGIGFFHLSDGVHIDGIKLATAMHCVCIDLYKLCRTASLPPALSRFLQLPDITFVGVGIKHPLDALCSSYGVKCRNAVDLGSLAADVEGDKRLEAYGLIDLARRVCNIRVKSGLLKEYLDRVVFARTIADACAEVEVREEGTANAGVVDAHLAFMIGNRLLGGLMPYSHHVRYDIVANY